MQAIRPLAAAALLALPAPGVAQAPAYDTSTLGCARFSESTLATLESNFTAGRRRETLGRDGVLSVRAAPAAAGLALEMWYDTLAVFREGPEGRYAPDASGILGGRYIGVLDPQGDYLSNAVPFVPAALRDIFDFRRIPVGFFPPLSPVSLAAGGEWTDGAGLTVWRLADSAGTMGPVARYRWIRREWWEEGIAAGDSTVVVHRTESDAGSMQWRTGEGPLGWTSSAEARVDFSNGAGRSELTQETRVRRLPAQCR